MVAKTIPDKAAPNIFHSWYRFDNKFTLFDIVLFSNKIRPVLHKKKNPLAFLKKIWYKSVKWLCYWEQKNG